MIQKPEYTLEKAIRANYPLIVVESWEEARVTEIIAKVCDEIRFTVGQGDEAVTKKYALVEWTATEGLRITSEGVVVQGAPSPKDTTLINNALNAIKNWKKFSPEDAFVFLFKDIHKFIDKDPVTLRHLRDVVALFQSQLNVLVLLSPQIEIPSDLQKDVFRIDWPLPDDVVLGEIITRAQEIFKKNQRIKVKAISAETRATMISNMRGLTHFEARSVLAMSATLNLALDESAIPIIAREKRSMVQRSVGLEWFDAGIEPSQIGGLEDLKRDVLMLQREGSPDADAYGLEPARGMFVCGCPGTGKSLVAKMVAGGKRATVRWDISAMEGGLVGQTASQTIQTLKVLDALGDIVIWIDEVDKALAGTAGPSLDGGSKRGLLGLILTWMQERTGQGFIVATANDIRGMPAAFIRRFDSLWFVDVPNLAERVAILKIHLSRDPIKRDPAKFDLEKIAGVLDGYSGDEIRKVVREAQRFGFHDGGRDFDTADMLIAADNIVPVSVTSEEEIAAMRKWALEGRARFASGQEAKKKVQKIVALQTEPGAPLL